jgi:hypothetical protein
VRQDGAGKGCCRELVFPADLNEILHSSSLFWFLMSTSSDRETF